MDRSACLLLRQLYLADVCGVQGWITWGKLLVCVDVGDKVRIIFCLTEGRTWRWQLRAQWWLRCEMEVEAELQHVRLNCYSIVGLEGNIFFMKCDLRPFIAHTGFKCATTHKVAHIRTCAYDIVVFILVKTLTFNSVYSCFCQEKDNVFVFYLLCASLKCVNQQSMVISDFNSNSTKSLPSSLSNMFFFCFSSEVRIT